MNEILSAYQQWKQQGEALRSKAKQAMEARFRELMVEAVRIAEEYRADFGVALKPPAPVTAFRYKEGGAKAKKAVAKEAPAAAPPPAVVSAKVTALEKKLAAARKKLEEAKAAAKPTRAIEDRIYEIEDAIRLAGVV